ncbi:L-lactate dehydrogenase complex protein LldG [Micromonospora luteifusca]|uniref:L-lactate dehydrogenase complex protein LldG n=1 Tax=Micromonospora luteifusca TaxID=709860 RepID=A0ABS2LM56_9ACTN|nr:LUD domain-containing protein [Micromonospora luteifusca]MBM7489269.1 L-lactate dehydrogenase complex protein LldG [Micromonospora luteifusca]
MTARDEILARLRTALADSPPPVHVPRRYRRVHDRPDLVEVLIDRLEDYRAVVHRGIDALAGLLAEVDRLAVPTDIPADWLAGYAGQVRRDAPPLSPAELDVVDAVLTGCAVAVADTGTIILDTGPAQGRRALTLVPDRHICVVRTDQVVGLLPEALARLDPRAPQTWISGPSATSDIELNRVEGVHGPRRLEVVLVGLDDPLGR